MWRKTLAVAVAVSLAAWENEGGPTEPVSRNPNLARSAGR